MHLQPLFKWAGSKRDELQEIGNFIPTEFSTYIEPFAGGAALFFYMNRSDSILCDNNVELMNFYQQIKNGKASEIDKKCQSFGFGDKDYYMVRDDYTPTSEVDRAAKYIYILKTCFRGMTRYNKKGKFNIPWGRYGTVDFSFINSIPHQELLKTTNLIVGDFTKVLPHIQENTFVFLDPPYDTNFSNYFLPFGQSDYQRIYDELFTRTDAYVLMVVSDTPFIRKLFQPYIFSSYEKKYRFRITKKRLKTSQTDVTHLVIVNSKLKHNLQSRKRSPAMEDFSV